MLKVNQNRETSAKQVAAILNNCEMLFSLDIIQHGSNYILFVETDQSSIEYKEMSLSGMEWFLGKLKTYADNKEDIDMLFEELECLRAS